MELYRFYISPYSDMNLPLENVNIWQALDGLFRHLSSRLSVCDLFPLIGFY